MTPVCQVCGALLDEETWTVCTDPERHQAALARIEEFWKDKGYVKSPEGRYCPQTGHTIYSSPYTEYLATGSC